MYDAKLLGSPIKQFTAPNYRTASFYTKVAVSPAGDTLFGTSSDGNIYVWDVEAEGDAQGAISVVEVAQVAKGHTAEASSIACSQYDDIDWKVGS